MTTTRAFPGEPEAPQILAAGLDEELAALMKALAGDDADKVCLIANRIYVAGTRADTIGRLRKAELADLTAAALAAVRLHRCKIFARRERLDSADWSLAQAAIEGVLEHYLGKLLTPQPAVVQHAARLGLRR